MTLCGQIILFGKKCCVFHFSQRAYGGVQRMVGKKNNLSVLTFKIRVTYFRVSERVLCENIFVILCN